MVYTAAIREVILENPSIPFRVYQRANFQDVGAHHHQQRSYGALLRDNKVKLLSKYLNE